MELLSDDCENFICTGREHNNSLKRGFSGFSGFSGQPVLTFSPQSILTLAMSELRMKHDFLMSDTILYRI